MSIDSRQYGSVLCSFGKIKLQLCLFKKSLFKLFMILASTVLHWHDLRVKAVFWDFFHMVSLQVTTEVEELVLTWY